MKTMKRVLSLLISLTMVLSMAMAGFTADAVSLKLTPSKSAPEVGDEFTVTASIDSNSGFNGASVQLTWNDEVVEFQGFEAAYDEDAEATLPTSNFNTGSSIVYNDETGNFQLARTNNTTKTGTLFVAKFKAIAAGDSSISYDADSFAMYAGDGAAISVTPDVSALNNMSAVTDSSSSTTTAAYTASLTPATQAKAKNETAEVKLNLASTTNTTFNALYASLTYDPTYLTLKTTSLTGYTLNDNNGKITIAGYGADKNVGDVITLEFIVLGAPEGGTDVTLTKANVDASANAAAQNAPEAAYGDKTATITLSGYSVTYPTDDFTGAESVKPGEDYTLTAKDKNYDYTFNATMGGQSVAVTDNKDGTYTIENVTGNLNIAIATKTGKSFDVTVNGAADGQVTAADKATYGTDYTFTVGAVTNNSTTVAVTIGGVSYTGFTAENGTYTIPGKDITGAVVITVTNTVASYGATFEGTGAGNATQTTPAEDMKLGSDYTFTVNKEAGYDYTITATMNGEAATIIDNGDGTYTIKNVTGDLVITVVKTEIPASTTTVTVQEYMKVNDSAVYLVTAADTALAEGSVLTYDGNAMFWSEKYSAYAYLVISDEVLTVEAATEKVAQSAATTAAEIDYTGDVNGTEVTDINDAQLVYDIYNAKYADFDALMMTKFLRADVNGDKVVNVNDAAAIVSTIVGAN